MFLFQEPKSNKCETNPDAGVSLGAGVFGHGFGPLGDGVLGQLPRQQQAHGGLHLPAGDGGALVVLSEARRLGGDPLEHVVHEGVHDAHGPARDAGIRVNLKVQVKAGF